jgi:hypothetical protein
MPSRTRSLLITVASRGRRSCSAAFMPSARRSTAAGRSPSAALIRVPVHISWRDNPRRRVRVGSYSHADLVCFAEIPLGVGDVELIAGGDAAEAVCVDAGEWAHHLVACRRPSSSRCAASKSKRYVAANTAVFPAAPATLGYRVSGLAIASATRASIPRAWSADISLTPRSTSASARGPPVPRRAGLRGKRHFEVIQRRGRGRGTLQQGVGPSDDESQPGTRIHQLRRYHCDWSHVAGTVWVPSWVDGQRGRSCWLKTISPRQIRYRPMLRRSTVVG